MSFSRYSNDIPRITEEEEEDEDDPVPRRVLETRQVNRPPPLLKPDMKDMRKMLKTDTPLSSAPGSPAPWAVHSVSPRASTAAAEARNSGVGAIQEERETPEEERADQFEDQMSRSGARTPSDVSPDETPTTRFQIPPKSQHVSAHNMDKGPGWKTRRPTPYYTSQGEAAVSEKDDYEEEEAPTCGPPGRHESVDTRSNYSRKDSASGSSVSKDSTKYSDGGSFMVSTKMMEKLSAFDDSREGSFASSEEFKPGALSSGGKKWPGLSKEEIKRRKKAGFYGPWWSPTRYSTRFLILLVFGVLSFTALALGLSIGLWRRAMSLRPPEMSTWKPSPETTWQIQLGSPLDTPSYNFAVYDVDLFDTNVTTIKTLQGMGRRVICYFSAGTYESWRSDAGSFPSSTLGAELPGWEGERYVDYRDHKVRQIMLDRINLARKKGCDGVDPDNIDAYTSTNSTFKLTQDDAVDFLTYMAKHARDQKLAIGLKNAPQIASRVIGDMQWVITESCAQFNECSAYRPFVELGRPVFHIEYPDSPATGVNETVSLSTWMERVCTAKGTHGFSTLIKKTQLDDWALECPFSDIEFGYI